MSEKIVGCTVFTFICSKIVKGPLINYKRKKIVKPEAIKIKVVNLTDISVITKISVRLGYKFRIKIVSYFSFCFVCFNFYSFFALTMQFIQLTAVTAANAGLSKKNI